MDVIYLDNNATTPLLPAAWEAMKPYWLEAYGNPASAHQVGRRARQGLENAREKIASILGAYPDEVVFTSGATEANNLALLGLAGSPPQRILASPIEHPSVEETLQHLHQQGFVLDKLAVDSQGIVEPDSLIQLARPDTRLVAVMLANNETGALAPVRQLVDLCASLPSPPFFHCDAVQAVGKIPVHFHDLGVSTLSISAHKFHGPKGIGALLIRRGVKPQPNFWGGHQQQGRRPGTEAVALAVGMAAALDAWQREAETRTTLVRHLRKIFLERLRSEADPIVINGPASGAEVSGLPHTLNLSFPGCRADILLMRLDMAGVACSTGSACSSGSLLPSPVLRAMKVPEEVLHSAMRFSFSPLLSEKDVTEAADRVAVVVGQIRLLADGDET